MKTATYYLPPLPRFAGGGPLLFPAILLDLRPTFSSSSSSAACDKSVYVLFTILGARGPLGVLGGVTLMLLQENISFTTNYLCIGIRLVAPQL